MIRILIAVDNPTIRRCLKELLIEEFEQLDFGEAKNNREVLELARKQDWNIVLLEFSLPGSGGLEVLRDLKTRHPGLPVLVLGLHPEEQYAPRVLKAGARGYLIQETLSEQLVHAIYKTLTNAATESKEEGV